MLKNRNTQIVLIVILLVIFSVGGYFLFSGGNKQKQTADDTVNENLVQTLSPKDIGLKLQAGPDNNKIKFSIENASGIKSVDYELIYEADSTAQERKDGGDARVQRGITGHADVNGKGSYTSDWLILGSQSANVVRYDTGVNGVNITLKITKTNGQVYQVEDKLDF